MLTLAECREKIDQTDEQLLRLFIQRMEISKNVAEVKQAQGIATENKEREQQILDKRCAQAGEEMAPYVEEFFKCMISQSKRLQEALKK